MNIDDYINIHGWFDHHTDGKIFDYVVSKLNPNSNLAECGVWLGRSTCYVNYLIKTQNKNIKHYAFDNFDHIHNLLADPREANTTIVCNEVLNKSTQYDLFSNNKNKYFSDVNVVNGSFNDEIQKFSNFYFDAIYIDMCHDYSSVYSNLSSCFSKLKNNGILFGHDYGYPDVYHAVNEFNKLNGNKEIKNICGSFLIEY
jgi:SAM-dependent MidA family methyltransferase